MMKFDTNDGIASLCAGRALSITNNQGRNRGPMVQALGKRR